MPDIEIRDALPSEYAQVGEVTVGGYQGHSMPSYAAKLRDVEGRAKSADIIVAVLDGVIVSAVAYVHKGGEYEDIAFGPTEAEFRMLVVSDAGRGLGIGEAMSLECIRRAKADGRTHMVISVAPGNLAAERIYERLGFHREPSRDWVAEDGFSLGCWVLDLEKAP